MKYVARDKILTVLCIAHGEEFVRGDLPLGEGQPPPAPPVASVPPPAPPTPAPQPLRPTDRSCIRSVVRRSQKRFRDKILPVAQERRRFKQRIKTLCHWCGDTTGGRIMFKGRGKGRQSAPICDDCYDEITGKSNGFNILAGWNRNRVFGCGHIDWHESGSSFDNIVRAAEEVATGGADD
jgi:hypothetical protein